MSWFRGRGKITFGDKQEVAPSPSRNPGRGVCKHSPNHKRVVLGEEISVRQVPGSPMVSIESRPIMIVCVTCGTKTEASQKG